MPKPRLFITALLGTPPGSPRHIHDNLWFLADFLMAHRLLAQQAPLDHQSWLSQIDIYSEVEKVKKTIPVLFHGPRHLERFVLPPPGEENPFYLDGPDLKEAFLRVVTRLAGRARKVDHLVFLIFGHGDPTAFEVGSFQCGAGFGGETVWLTKKELEAALKGTKAGRVSLVSTSCYAGDLASDHWALFFSAAQTKESLALPTYASNRGWGSLLWAAIPELAANSYGHTFHPALQQPQIMLFKPIIQEDHLMPLTENSELPRSGSVTPPLQLGISDCGETINQTCATLFNTISGATSHNFYPTFPDNAQWASLFAVLGVDSCLELVRRAHGLAHQPPNPSTHNPPPATGSFNPQSNNIDQDGTYDDDFSGQMENSDIRDDADADKEHRRSPSLAEEDETEVDTELLTGMLKRWLHDTGPLALDTAARRSLLRKAESFLQGTADLSLKRALFRQFCARSAADALAQQLAETLGIAHPESRCADFREVEDLPAYLGLQLYRMRWGRLAPHDDNGGTMGLSFLDPQWAGYRRNTGSSRCGGGVHSSQRAMGNLDWEFWCSAIRAPRRVGRHFLVQYYKKNAIVLRVVLVLVHGNFAVNGFHSLRPRCSTPIVQRYSNTIVLARLRLTSSPFLFSAHKAIQMRCPPQHREELLLSDYPARQVFFEWSVL